MVYSSESLWQLWFCGCSNSSKGRPQQHLFQQCDLKTSIWTLAKGLEGRICASDCMLCYSPSVTMDVCQTCICITALVTHCITWQSSPLFLHTFFINKNRFLGLRAEWVKPRHAPCAENTSRFLLKNAVSNFLLGRIPISNWVHFCPVISSIKGDIIVAWLLSSDFAMKKYPQNLNLETLKSKYMISIQGVRRQLINCY